MSLAEETEAGSASRLLELIGEKVPAQRAEPIRAFAQAYLRRLSGDAAEGIPLEQLLAEVVGAFEFASAREAPVAVRAFNPTLDAHGYEPLGSVVETNTEDWPFLVDSVSGALESHRLEVVRLLHPVIGVERDGDSRIVSVGRARDARHRESVMHFDLGRKLNDEQLEEVERAVREALVAVQKVVTDFQAMTERVDDMITVARAGTARYPRDEVHEVADFLEWLLQGNFVLLGAREYDISEHGICVIPDSGLGILRDEERSTFATNVPLAELPPEIRERATTGDLLLVAKTNATSPVHKFERMDYIGVRRVSRTGEIVGESRLLGLFTSKAYAERASETPLLHRKMRQGLDAEDLIEGSHDYKAAVTLFDSFPKEELFAAPVDDLRRAVVSLIGLEGSDRVRLLGRRDADGRSASLILGLPRARYSSELVSRVTSLLKERFETSAVEAYHVLDEGQRARVHFSVHSAEGLPEVPLPGLEEEAVALARTWDDELATALGKGGRALAKTWGARFPDHYKGYTMPELAAIDVACFTRLDEGESFVVSLHPIGEARLSRVALYKRGAKIELSRAMPMLEDLGLRVIEEISTRLRGRQEMWVQEFRVLGPGEQPLDLDDVGDRVAEAIAAVYRGEAESDPLNRLVITAGLDRSQVAILRAYRKYRQRIGSRFTEGYQNDVLVANSPITAKLVRYFELRFDPAVEPDEAAERDLRDEILADLEDVSSIDHDRILRNQLGAIDATLRTSAFKEGRAATAFKLRSADVPAIPMPAPEFEIYVYAGDMEGIHLRGGKIARGGIRFSDRMDYRTEVYGLMRAQLTKNAIIVPAGAKGGFIVKRQEITREAIQECYVTYVRSLLDVTDNLVDGQVIHPDQVRVRDEEDTYLVVAADKGTATFSDTANAVSHDYGFWLDDAFASGGSVGYDHKKLGITARGAWESVKRHFRELGMDPARDEFTVVGIGDMSGDVFGNGMLLSDKIKLLAAYDHRHVFIDPDPDPATSFAERKRLFERPGSSWADYGELSEGGGVYPRDAKWVELSDRARELLGLEEGRVAPNDVIRAILRAQVDLLWNGGIGTVVKASSETDADAHDRASDAIRVDARDLRCRVVGEGGNLGFTRRARVEFSAHGGLINADFIDNSAGVDCSDHEVNLKILLGLAERHGEMTRPQRDELLEAVTEDVVAHVLYDSFLQAQIIAQEVGRAPGRMFAYEDLATVLEETGLLDRASESLPGGDELTERRRAGRGLERPELAIFLAYGKRWVARSLEESGFADDPWLERDLHAYFPGRVVERCGHLLAQHPLRTQLICMLNANAVVNALGPTFVSQLVAERAADVAEVVRAYRIAVEVTDAAPLWEAIEELDSIGRGEQLELLGGIDALVEATARWYLTWAPGAPFEETVAAGRDGFGRLAAVLASLGTDDRRRRREETVERLTGEGVPEDVAWAHALRAELVHAPDMVAVAASTERSIEDVARVFFALGAELRLDWMERELARVRSSTRMQRWALQAVREDAFKARRELAEAALRESAGAEPLVAVERFLHEHAAQAVRLDAFLRALAREGESDLAGLALAVRQLGSVVSSS